MQDRRCVARASAVALLTVCLIVGSNAPAGAQADARTELCSQLPGRSLPASIQEADRLVLDRSNPQDDAAAETYRAVLRDDPKDDCAVRGLARIGQEQQAGQEAGRTWLTRASDRWDELYAGWFGPATGLLLLALAVLLVLLVVTRLLTRRLVPVDALEWPAPWRTLCRWTGLLALCLASLLPVALSVLPAALDGAVSAADTASIVAVLLLAAGLLVLARTRRAHRSRGRDLAVTVAGASLLSAAAGVAAIALLAEDGQTATDLVTVGRTLALLLLALLTVFLVLAFVAERWAGRLWEFLPLPSEEGSREVSRWIALVMVCVVAAFGAAHVADVVLPDAGANLDGGWSWARCLWVLAVVLAVVGVVLTGRAQGLRLRLQVDVMDAEGDHDANGASYLIARLEQLGSDRPRELELPLQTDVTTLPEDALTALPQGRVAAAVVNALRAVLPTVPWRSTVRLVDDQTVTVILERNGKVVEELTRIGLPELTLPGTGDGGDGEQATARTRGQLLTAAAAYSFFALVRRHPRLVPGLCGATVWKSSALHVLATEGPLPDDPALEQRLLAEAVGLDPGNATARLAYLLLCFGRRGKDPDDQRAFAGLVWQHYGEVFWKLFQKSEWEPPERGFEALQLRFLYARAAACMNLHLLLAKDAATADEAAVALLDARGAARWLIRRLSQQQWGDEGLAKFVEDVRPSARLLWNGIRDVSDWWQLDPANADPDWWQERADLEAEMATAAWQTTPATGLSRDARYGRACWLAQRPYDNAAEQRDGLHQAIEDLRESASVQRLRDWARDDPSLAIFRDPATDHELRSAYKKIVGDPPPSRFLQLTPFAEHAERLRAYGVDDAERLAGASAWRLAVHLGVELSTVQHWQGIARLAGATRDGTGGDDVAAVQLLIDCGVRSPEALREHLRTGPSRNELYTAMVQAAAGLVYEPDRATTVDHWNVPVG